MARWTELNGKYVDLDDVKAVEFIEPDSGFSCDQGGRARLTVPGGSIDLPMLPDVDAVMERLKDPEVEAYRRPYPTPPDRPGFWSRRATKDAYDKAHAEYRRECEQAQRDRDNYEYARRAAMIASSRARYDALVCEIGARDCGDEERT